jgi:GNAT superfamily N-acetyltransferase
LKIVRVDEPGIAACGQVLSRAFHEDPLQVYMLPDEAARLRLSPRQFEASLRYGWLYGLALTTEGEPRGAAVWLRPGETEISASRAQAAGMDDLAGPMGPEGSVRSLRIWRLFADTRAREARARYWYLMVIGVLPESRGQGIGTALMQPALAQADSDRLPCFVETAQPRNVPLYERHGFRLVWDHSDVASGLRLMSFVRPPHA